MNTRTCKMSGKSNKTNNSLTYFVLPSSRQRQDVFRVYAVSDVRENLPAKYEGRVAPVGVWGKKRHKVGEAPFYRVRFEDGKLGYEELEPASPEFLKVQKWVGQGSGNKRSLLNHPGIAKTKDDITRLLIKSEQKTETNKNLVGTVWDFLTRPRYTNTWLDRAIPGTVNTLALATVMNLIAGDPAYIWHEKQEKDNKIICNRYNPEPKPNSFNEYLALKR